MVAFLPHSVAYNYKIHIKKSQLAQSLFDFLFEAKYFQAYIFFSNHCSYWSLGYTVMVKQCELRLEAVYICDTLVVLVARVPHWAHPVAPLLVRVGSLVGRLHCFLWGRHVRLFYFRVSQDLKGTINFECQMSKFKYIK